MLNQHPALDSLHSQPVYGKQTQYGISTVVRERNCQVHKCASIECLYGEGSLKDCAMASMPLYAYQLSCCGIKRAHAGGAKRLCGVRASCLQKAEGHSAQEVELRRWQLRRLNKHAVAEAIDQQAADLGARRDYDIVLRRLAIEPAKQRPKACRSRRSGQGASPFAAVSDCL